MVFAGLRPPAIGGISGRRGGQPKLRRLVIAPEHAALGAEGAGAARHAGRRFVHLELRLAAMAASLDRHGLLLWLSGFAPHLIRRVDSPKPSTELEQPTGGRRWVNTT